jgi:hypothetical protein
LPTQLTGDKDNPLQQVQRIERVVIEPVDTRALPQTNAITEKPNIIN